jgi:hypothetical protein
MLTICTITSLFFGGVAVAQQPGSTSGPAAGSNIEPSTAVQKQQGEGRSVGGVPDFRSSAQAAGAPGIEGKPGTQGGTTHSR